MKKEKNINFDGKSWGFDFTRKEKRIRRRGFITRAQAERELHRKKTNLIDEEIGLRKRPSAEILFSDFADVFLKIYSIPNKRSWRGDKFILASLKKCFHGETLRSITVEKIQRFVAARMTEDSKTTGKKISPATVNRSLALLKTLFNKAVEWGRIETSPAARVKKLREPNGRERFLNHDEAARLLAAADPALVPVLVVALGTGMRKGEILGLEWRDLDFTNKEISVRMTKEGKPRKIPMSGAVAVALGGVLNLGEFVFWNEETKTRIKDVKKMFREAIDRAKIKGFRFHDLRHTALTWMFQEGADIISVQKIAGHRSVEITARYIHETEESKQTAVDRVGLILRRII